MREKLPSLHTSHDKPQHYQHKYCLVCMTGLIGCRWHRYQQSTRESRKRDLLFFTLILLCLLHMALFFYFWLVSRNNIYQVTVDMYLYTQVYFSWSDVGLGLSAIMLVYFLGIVILCLFHVQFGHQLYLHPCHLFVSLLLEMICIIISVLLNVYWTQSWPLVYLSLRVYSPFLQVAAVLTLTALAWLIVHQWFRLTLAYKMLWLLVMLIVLLALYVIPFWIDSPIITSSTPDKPEIIAMGGASNIAPENTLYAFKKAYSLGVTRMQTTVQISFDGIPFLFHDNTLVRTTDFEDLGNNNLSVVPMQNTMLELQMLNAGSWFTKYDPWKSTWRLSVNETSEINAQKIPTLSELLQLGRDYPAVEFFLIVQPLPDWHPFCCDASNIIDSVISQSWFNRSNVYVPVWLYHNVTQNESFMPAEPHREATSLYMMFDSANLLAKLSGNQKHSLKTIVSDVNSQWLLSVVWCAGADLVATRYIEHIQDIMRPILQLDVNSYIALWVTVDVLSIIIIMAIFIVHRIRLYGTSFSPESISLNTGHMKTSYRSRTMKEKLLRECTMVDSMDELEARDNDGMENRPAYSMMSGHQTYSLSSLIGSQSNTDTIMDRDGAVVALEPGHTLPASVSNRYSV